MIEQRIFLSFSGRVALAVYSARPDCPGPRGRYRVGHIKSDGNYCDRRNRLILSTCLRVEYWGLCEFVVSLSISPFLASQHPHLDVAAISTDTNAARAVFYIRVELDKISSSPLCPQKRKLPTSNVLPLRDHLSKLQLFSSSLSPISLFLPRVLHPPSPQEYDRWARVVIPRELLDSV